LLSVEPRRYTPELALIAVTVAYGSTFKIVQDALVDVTPVGYMLLRFGVAAAVLLPFAIVRGWRRPDVPDASRRAFVYGVALFGVVGFLGYLFQNLGLEKTSTSNSAFITGLLVVFTPLIETVVTHRRPPSNVLIAVGVAVIGLWFISGGTYRLGAGDAWTLACAFMFGAWMVLGGRLTLRFDAIALTAYQVAILALLSVPVVVVDGMGDITGQVIFAALLTGTVCSAGAFSLQLWGQRYIEPSRAAVILQFEPIVAGVVGFWVGERLGWMGYVGAVIILAGIVIAESRTWRHDAASTSGPAAPRDDRP
jgi:drug/metabolite transporter (DMT)-like permease